MDDENAKLNALFAGAKVKPKPIGKAVATNQFFC